MLHQFSTGGKYSNIDSQSVKTENRILAVWFCLIAPSLRLFLDPSRRSDLQILGFCLLHWLCGSLPWDKVLKDPTQVQEAKARLVIIRNFMHLITFSVVFCGDVSKTVKSKNTVKT